MCFLQTLLMFLCPVDNRKNRMRTRPHDAKDTDKVSDDAMQKEWHADFLEQDDVFQLEQVDTTMMRHPSKGLDVYCSDYDDDMMP